MRTYLKFAALCAGILAVGATSISTADAHRKHRWRSVGECYPAMEGAATSQGILGLGSARARVAAQETWEDEVARRYGEAFAHLGNARRVQWDCKKGAVILAKCVVTAEPCSARIRG